jgi:hypothetical protein
MHCDEGEGTQHQALEWHRRDLTVSMDALTHFHVLLLSLDVLQALAQSKHRLFQWREVLCRDGHNRRDRAGSGKSYGQAGNRQGTRHQHTTKCMARLVIVVGISRLIHLLRQRPGADCKRGVSSWHVRAQPVLGGRE